MRIRSRRVFFSLSFSFSLSPSSLSFPPHGGDTTVPSALHLFNKDLLCSKTLIQNTHTHIHTHTLSLSLSLSHTHTHAHISPSSRHRPRKGKKKVRDVGLETLGALFVNSHSDERRESRLAHRGRNANYGLLCLHVAHTNTPIWSYNYKLVIHVFMVRWKHKSARLWAKEYKRCNQSGEEMARLKRRGDRIRL